MPVTKEDLITAIASKDDKAAIVLIATLLADMLENQTVIAASLERLAQCVVSPNENYATASFQTFNRS